MISNLIALLAVIVGLTTYNLAEQGSRLEKASIIPYSMGMIWLGLSFLC